MSTKSLFLRPVLNLVDVLTEVMQSILILAILLLPVELLAPAWRIPLYPLLAAAACLTYLIRKTCRYIWQFIFFGLVVIVLPLYLPLLPAFQDDFRPRLILAASLIFLTARSFYLRIIRRMKDAPIGDLSLQSLVLVLLIGLNIVASRFGLSMISQIYFYLSVVYLVLAVIRWHWVSLTSQMERFMSMPSQPIARIIRFNKILLAGYIISAAILMILSPILHLHDLIPWLGQLLLAAVRWLVSLLSRGEPAETTPETSPTSGPTEANPPFPIDNTEPAQWLIILQEIFYYLFVIAALAAAVGLIVYLLYRLYRRFYDVGQPDTDKSESLLPNIAAQVMERLDRTKNRWLTQFGQAPEQKIRRLYYRLIESQIRYGLVYKPSLTARQLVDLLDHVQFPELNAVNYLYEQARYGSGICTSADVTHMQTLVRSLYRKNLTLPQTIERDPHEKNKAV